MQQQQMWSLNGDSKLILNLFSCSSEIKGNRAGFFSWRPNCQHQNLMWPKTKKVNVPKLVKGVSLLSFRVYWSWRLFWYMHCSANLFHFGVFTMVIRLFILFIFFIFWGHSKACDTNLKPSRPKFGSRPYSLKTSGIEQKPTFGPLSLFLRNKLY